MAGLPTPYLDDVLFLPPSDSTRCCHVSRVVCLIEVCGKYPERGPMIRPQKVVALIRSTRHDFTCQGPGCVPFSGQPASPAPLPTFAVGLPRRLCFGFRHSPTSCSGGNMAHCFLESRGRRGIAVGSWRPALLLLGPCSEELRSVDSGNPSFKGGFFPRSCSDFSAAHFLCFGRGGTVPKGL